MTDERERSVDRADLADTRADLASDRADLASSRADLAATRADASDHRADVNDNRADQTDTTIAELQATLQRISCLMGEKLDGLELKLDNELKIESGRRRREIGTLAAAVALIVIAATAATAGFHRQAVRLCDGQNQNRLILTALIEASTAPAAAPPGSSPELVQAFADSNRRGADFLAHARPLLRVADCSALGWVP